MPRAVGGPAGHGRDSVVEFFTRWVQQRCLTIAGALVVMEPDRPGRVLVVVDSVHRKGGDCRSRRVQQTCPKNDFPGPRQVRDDLAKHAIGLTYHIDARRRSRARARIHGAVVPKQEIVRHARHRSAPDEFPEFRCSASIAPGPLSVSGGACVPTYTKPLAPMTGGVMALIAVVPAQGAFGCDPRETPRVERAREMRPAGADDEAAVSRDRAGLKPAGVESTRSHCRPFAG